jgi:hypothetical protein
MEYWRDLPRLKIIPLARFRLHQISVSGVEARSGLVAYQLF